MKLYLPSTVHFTTVLDVLLCKNRRIQQVPMDPVLLKVGRYSPCGNGRYSLNHLAAGTSFEPRCTNRSETPGRGPS